MKKIFSKVISMVVALLVLASMLTVSVSAADIETLVGQKIVLTPSADEVNPGDTVTVSMAINNVNYISGVQIVVTWDPELLTADTATSMGKPKCFTYPKANSDGYSITDSLKSATAAPGKLTFAAVAGYVFEDYEETLDAGSIKFTVNEAAAGKTVEVCVAAAEYGTTGAIIGGTYAVDENTKNVNFDAPVNASIKVAGGEPTAKDYGLFTDAKQNFKVTTPVMTSNKYAIEKALGFVSGINKDVKLACGTEITCAGSDKVLDIPAEHFYEATDLVNGFVAAVTSIRDTNLDKEFSARAYVIVDGVKVYADETAKAVYSE